MVQKFEDLEVWQESINLSVELYKMLKGSKDFGLRDQLQRSAVSIPSNIAEGFERKTNKEFVHYLHIAKGSCAELRTQLYIAKETDLLNQENADKMIESTRKISAMLYKLIQTRKNNF